MKSIAGVRRITVIAAAAAAAAGLAVSGPAIANAMSASAGQSSRITPLCQTPGLVVWLDTRGSGTLGSVFYNLEFTNLSGHRCTLNGFPFINAVSLAGRSLGSTAQFAPGFTPHTVTVGNGKTVKAVLQIVDAGNFPRSSCHQVTAAGLRVFPPNQTRAKTVPFPFGACSRRGPMYLVVRPVVR
jgi:hypothetical protein